ncbi:acyltransferase family protein [Dinoroseobacter shibae DFL 12 = DSM 16493]|jgi:peptidoglycan/LPS O-acetylase OafA/YrhL|uniref:Acyltransferase family protein n=1 Tax=Dinoroseobacter shibae (strain DSM 16493 / NCIMB 14021 / DFL 12) TaxID=398580 RepID=A8LLI2_DINSH|nr:acyltransferase [Dinoroseobacter shibae]ABV91992.1 acyltransferase family protein [Dinoroseobacter shibae DFL 12 = DSM 16493]URF46962.1 acyltransferase [Dinoroseobacter shibae]URF51273.1 acyltransferase [Dinoroseobacter shibae]
MSGARPMSPGFSLWLDVLRAGAALTVLFGHMAHTRFTRGDYEVLRDWNLASDAVVVFFVLSGVVIAYAAERDGTLGRFAFHRLTRVLSVVAPALVLTLLFDAIGQRLDLRAYQPPFFEALPVAEMLWRGLSFSNEWQGLSDRVRLGSNGPLWSLSYEVAFYALFAIAFYLRGFLRWVLLALGALLAGLPILALMPCWLLGVALWHHIQRALALPRSRAWALALGGPVTLVALKAAGLAPFLSALTAAAVAPASHHALLGYSDEVLWNTLLALCVAAHLRGVHALCVGRTAPHRGRPARAVRWIAQGSFSLYVLHYPVLHLLDAGLPEALPGYDLWLLALTLLACFAFAALFERRLPQQRARLRQLWCRLHKPRSDRPERALSG